MKKDGRFWILVGGLVIVGGLFVAFLWSVMAAPSEPVGNQVVANVSEPAPTTNSIGDKPADTDVQPMMGDPTPMAPPPPNLDDVRNDAEQRMRDARAQIERAQADARQAADRAQAEARRATDRAQANARRAAERARQQRRRAATGGKPTDDKPPEDW